MNFGSEVNRTDRSEHFLKEGEYSIGNFVFEIHENNRLGKGGCAEVFRGKST